MIDDVLDKLSYHMKNLRYNLIAAETRVIESRMLILKVLAGHVKLLLIIFLGGIVKVLLIKLVTAGKVVSMIELIHIMGDIVVVVIACAQTVASERRVE